LNLIRRRAYAEKEKEEDGEGREGGMKEENFRSSINMKNPEGRNKCYN
jgi:hypothetical protein